LIGHLNLMTLHPQPFFFFAHPRHCDTLLQNVQIV